MKNLLIEEMVLAQILAEAIDSGDYIVCDRCGLVTPADQMFGAVCHDCANDLVTEGLAREAEEIALVEAMAKDAELQDAYEMIVSFGVPFGASDLEFFLQ